MTILELFEKIEFKQEKDRDSMAGIHYLLYIILMDMALWHYERGYSMVVTDLISTEAIDEMLQRESDAHRTRRAADLRSRHLEPQDREDFKTHFNEKYKDVASISRSDLKPRLVVEHGEGKNRHFHVALNFRYRITNGNR